jgi:DtxR family transcriptional regulator, Mn-dependent transcriptional regulator
MVNHNNSWVFKRISETMSESVEMYLISIARIAEITHEEIVPIPRLAEKLDILPVSTNQMIRKLEETGLVNYLPYKGVQLTAAGREIAKQIQRHHDLWEIFLVNCLKFPIEAADSLACRLEHVMSNEEIEHLSEFLGDPTFNVNGMLLPSALSDHALAPEFPLTQIKVNQGGHVSRVTADQAVISFLSTAGLHPGVQTTIIARSDSGDTLVLVGDNTRIHLSSAVAAHIWLRRN